MLNPEEPVPKNEPAGFMLPLPPRSELEVKLLELEPLELELLELELVVLPLPKAFMMLLLLVCVLLLLLVLVLFPHDMMVNMTRYTTDRLQGNQI